MINRCRLILLGLVLVLFPAYAGATQIRNIVELKGSEESVISGIGVVVGLNGTGDGQFSSAHKAVLAAITRNLDPTATPADLTDSDSIALVRVSAVVPAQGVRSGVDKLDVTVATLKDAESLKGGMLLDAVLFGPGENGRAYAVATGNLMLEDEEEMPRRAKVVRGAHMVRDIPSTNLNHRNELTLVIHSGKASWQLAHYIAESINGVMTPSDDAEPIAIAKDQKNIVIKVPDIHVIAEGIPSADFVSQILRTHIDNEIAAGGAKVTINRTAGTIAITGDVELSPVTISHEGMTIQLTDPEPEPDPNQPTVRNVDFVALDPDNLGGPRMRQLLDALNTLNVDIKGRMAIIKTLHDMGALHAKLEYK